MQIFKKFDEDRSGLLEMDELSTMFKQNGLELGKKNTKDFFELIDADHSGSLSLSEFKQFLFDEDSKKSFREIMRNVRHDIKADKLPSGELDISSEFTNLKHKYLPYSFEEMLQFLHNLTKRN